MGLLSRNTDDDTDESMFSEDYATVSVGEKLANISANAVSEDRPAIVVRPHRDNGGINAMNEVLTRLYGTKTETNRTGIFSKERVNVSPAHALEIRYAAESDRTDRALTLQYVDGTPGDDNIMYRQLNNEYHDSLVEEQPSHFLSLQEGDYLAGATLGLRRYTLYPINNVDLDGFRADPTGAIMEEMAGATEGTSVADADVVVQVMFQPAQRSWLNGVPNGQGIGSIPPDEQQIEGTPSVKDLTHKLRQPTYEIHRPVPWEREKIKHDPSKNDTAVAAMLEEQEGKAWRLFIRVFATASTPDTAQQRASNVASMFQNYYEYRGEQTFLAQPLDAAELPEAFERGATREWEDCGIVKTQREVAGVVNVPQAKDVATNKLRWSMAKPGDGVPPGTPRFPTTDYGVESRSDEEQVVMLDETRPGDPFWLGRGTKHGIETGLPAELLNAHMFVAGRTRYGKTTFLEHFQGQVFDRGTALDDLGISTGIDTDTASNTEDVSQEGQGAKERQGVQDSKESKESKENEESEGNGEVKESEENEEKEESGVGSLLIDPKGRDADDFIREWPDDRDEEDLIVIDLGQSPDGTGYEKIPRFNFMEIPPGFDPDSRFTSSMIEALADDIAAMVAQAGGSDKYLGSLMKRVTKAVCRGLLRSGRHVSLLDLACAVSSQSGLTEFSSWMSDERIAFIRETAQRFEDKEDSDLEPLAGRMDEWIHNDAIRDLIAARDPTFSIHEAVAQGKSIVVRFAKGAGETERRLYSTALIRRTYASKRVCDNDDPFYLICDEFDKIATEQSNLHTILSEAGGHNYRCVLACQAPATQLPKKLRDAVGNQVDTFLTFNPGTEDADYVAKHHTVDADTLRTMQRFKFYFRMHDTQSYLVDAFEPIRDVRYRTTGATAMTDEDIEAMKLRSMERYGEEVASPAEQQAASPFSDHATAEGGGDEDAAGFDITPERKRRVYKAVYDCCLEAGDTVTVGEGVTFETWVDRFRERSAPDSPASNASDGVYQDLKDQLVAGGELEENIGSDGNPRYRASDDAVAEILEQGKSPTGGGPTHRSLVRRMYRFLTGRVGLDMHVPTQGGSKSVADVVAEPRFELPANPMAAHSAQKKLEQENPLAWLLTRGAPTAVEVECSTGRRDPEKTAANLLNAVTDDRRCLFVVLEGNDGEDFDLVARRVWNTVTDPERVGDVPNEQWSLMIVPRDESDEPVMYRDGETRPLSTFEEGV